MAENAPAKVDFFISYTSADRDWADWIAFELRQAGFTTIHQNWDFRPGSNFVSDMKDALNRSERTIALYSPSYFNSGFGETEWTAAFTDATLLPIRIRACEIPKLLKPWVFIDLINLSEPTARNTLLNGVRKPGNEPRAKPDFPSSAVPQKQDIPQRRFPGALPPIWQVPAARNAGFTGRDAMLHDMHDQMLSNAGVAVTVLSGLGGVGKTQLAMEYSYRYASEYELVWWIRAEQPSTIASDYARLAPKLNLPEKDSKNQLETTDAVRDWLTQNRGWLLVFDNASKPEEIEPFVPSGVGGHILITSRNQIWGSLAERISIQTLARSESIAFLQKRTAKNEPEAADTVSALLGDLPLALEQAAGYIMSAGISIAGYRDRLKLQSKLLLRPVETTWALSIERLKQDHPPALDLLNLIAFLSADNIPRDLLESTNPDLLAFDESIAALRQYSLLDVNENGMSVHRLVQDVTRTSLPDDEQHKWVEAAIDLVNKDFPQNANDYDSWGICSKLMPHALESTSLADQLNTRVTSAARLLNQMGLYEKFRGQIRSSEDLFSRALKINEKIFGPESARVGAVCTNLGEALRMNGDLDGALLYAKRALDIEQKVQPKNHPDVAIAANNLSTVLNSRGDHEGALKYARQAWEVGEKAFAAKVEGMDEKTVSIYADNLAKVLLACDQYDEGLTYGLRALDIGKRCFGENHPSVGLDKNTIGMLLRSKGDLAGALPYVQQAYDTLAHAYGVDHPDTKVVENNLNLVKSELNARKNNVASARGKGASSTGQTSGWVQ